MWEYTQTEYLRNKQNNISDVLSNNIITSECMYQRAFGHSIPNDKA